MLSGVAVDGNLLRLARCQHAGRRTRGGTDVIGEDAAVVAGSRDALQADPRLASHARRQR
jgi:hypothetical protein